MILGGRLDANEHLAHNGGSTLVLPSPAVVEIPSGPGSEYLDHIVDGDEADGGDGRGPEAVHEEGEAGGRREDDDDDRDEDDDPLPASRRF